MTPSLQGKTILITGASMGIGEWVAREFARAGAHLILTARSEEKLKNLCQDLKTPQQNFTYLTCDLAQPLQVENLAVKILELGHLDGIIHNAGYGIYGEFEKVPEADVRDLFEVNFFSVLNLTRQLLPLLKKSPRPTVMMVSTVISWRAIPRMSAYCASKAALNLFTEAVRVEFKNPGIRVINVYPGRTRTAFSVNAKSMGWRPFSTVGQGMPPQKVAKKMLNAYVKGKRDEFVSLGNRLLIWANFLFPGMIDWGMGRYFKA